MARRGAGSAVGMAADGKIRIQVKSANIGKYRFISLINCFSRQSVIGI